MPSFRTALALVSLVLVIPSCGDAGGNRADGDGDSGITGATQTGTDGASEGASTGADEGDDGLDTTGGASCMASTDCPDGQICAAGECTPFDGMCTDDGECEGDSHCCTTGCLPDGEAGGFCIPYGDGEQNPECIGDVVIGLFEPSVQCEWLTPAPGDPFPNHVNVLATPLVGDTPYESGHGSEIVIVTYNGSDGGEQSGYGASAGYFGVVRVLDGQDCTLHGNVHDPNNPLIAASPPALADLDADGDLEIVGLRAIAGVVAFTWNDATNAYETMWVANGTNFASNYRWDGPAIHDLDNDGFPEIVSGSEVYDGLTGARLNPGQLLGYAGVGVFSIVGDVDGDTVPELVADDVYTWDAAMMRWELAYPGGPGSQHYAYADFGTAGATPETFDAHHLDGIAEIVSVGNNLVQLSTLDGQLLISGGIGSGGPPTIGDFDNDGFPEIASAGGTFYAVYDLDCVMPGAPGCASQYVRWTQSSQDASSANTGSSIFDFEGDGQAEAVYGDECYVRVYEGLTGEVLYSAARTSCTWYENPIVADPDRDENTEILVGSNTNCNVGCPAIDPIHRGQQCEDADGCVSGVCDQGFCRCVDDTGCSAGQVCAAPLPGTPGAGNTCRASHPPGTAISGVRVLRDRLDRWASSRELWNQHAYSITNIDDDQSVPKSSQWQANYTVAEYNNYRQNRQGDATAEQLPDITGELDPTACELDNDEITLNGTVCNRGLKAVAAALPATFYLGDPADGNVLCVAYTAEPVPVAECREVSCMIDAQVMGMVTMVVNDDGMGGKLTVECIDTNNTDVVNLDGCLPPG